MIIAVNTRFLLKDYLEGYGYFTYETFKRIVNRHKQHQFIFIFDRPYDPRFVFSENVTAVVAGPPARHPLLWRYWYDIKIPAVLKKYNADVFVSPDGYCSLKTKIPQCMVIHDLAFLHYPHYSKRSHLRYFKTQTPKFLRKAETIATVSQFSKNDIVTQYGIAPEKILVIYSAAKENFNPLDEHTKQEIKDRYSAGKEYFVYVGAIHPRKNLLNLLKAFSIFKKRLKSTMKLVLVGRLAWKYETFVEKLKNYKYRDDLVLTGYQAEDEVAGLVGSAYAMVYTSLFEGFGVPVIEAMKADVPVITSRNSSMEEIANGAALLADPDDFENIAEQMMTIYKDENLRRALIEKGRVIAQDYSWDHTADLLWNCIEKASG